MQTKPFCSSFQSIIECYKCTQVGVVPTIGRSGVK